MKEYKIGELARFINKDAGPRIYNKACRIAGVGGYLTKGGVIKQYHIEFLDGTMPASGNSAGFACDGTELEPLQKPKLGSWEELYETGWNPTGLEVEYVYSNKQEKSPNK